MVVCSEGDGFEWMDYSAESSWEYDRITYPWEVTKAYQLNKLAGEGPSTIIVARTKQTKRFIRSASMVYSSDIQTPPFPSAPNRPDPLISSGNMASHDSDPQLLGSSVDQPTMP